MSYSLLECTEVHFASFLSGGFITAIVVNPPERKLAKRTSVECIETLNLGKDQTLPALLAVAALV